MKKLILLFSAVAVAATFYSCNSEEMERLRAQNDSLRSVATTGGIKLDDYFAAFNSIQENLQTIKATVRNSQARRPTLSTRTFSASTTSC